MIKGNRISLLEKNPKGYSFEIKEVTRGNEYSVTVLEEIGRGGSCIVYRGTVEKDMGIPLFDGPAVIKEFYPKDLAEKGLRRANNGISLEIPEGLKVDFEEQKEFFCRGQAKHILFAGRHADKALTSASYSGQQNGTFYSVSDVSKGEVLSQKGRESFTIIDALKLATSICDVIGTLHTDTVPDEGGYKSEYKGEYKLYLDCKPSNIFVDSNYNAYLFDFDTVQPLYRYEFCSYSEGWGAPEQKIKSEDEGYKDNMLIGFHTDMFSIGAVLLWLLTGIEGPTKEDLDAIENGFDWRTRITLKDPTGAKDNEEFIENLDSLMRKLLKESAEERMHLYPDEESAFRAMSELDLLEKIAKHVLAGKEIEKAKQEIIVELKSTIVSAKPSNDKKVFQIPSRNMSFVERKDIISQIESVLNKGGSPLILSGMGGVGKTALAIEYAHSHKDYYNIVFWIDATDYQKLEDGCISCLDVLSDADNDNWKKKTSFKDFRDYFSQHNSWLLIFDNADYLYESTNTEIFLSGILQELSTLSNGHVIITSRSNCHISWANSLYVDVFSEEQALSFLQSKTKLDQDKYAVELVEECGYLPLALEYISSYIERQSIAYQEYLKLWDKHGTVVFDQSNYANVTIRKAFHITLDKLAQKNDKTALEFLELLARTGGEYIPLKTYVELKTKEYQDSFDWIKNDLNEKGRSYRVYRKHKKRSNSFDKLYSNRLKMFFYMHVYTKTNDERFIKRRRLIGLKSSIVDTMVPPGLFGVLNDEIKSNELLRELQEYSLIKVEAERIILHPLLREIIVSELPQDEKKPVYEQYELLADIYDKYGDYEMSSKYLFLSLQLRFFESFDKCSKYNGMNPWDIEKETLNYHMHGSLIDRYLFDIKSVITYFIYFFDSFKRIVELKQSEYIKSCHVFRIQCMNNVMKNLNAPGIALYLKELEIEYYYYISSLLGTGIIYKSSIATDEQYTYGVSYHYIDAGEYCKNNSVAALVDEWVEKTNTNNKIKELLENDANWTVIAVSNDIEIIEHVSQEKYENEPQREERIEREYYLSLSSAIGCGLIVGKPKIVDTCRHQAEFMLMYYKAEVYKVSEKAIGFVRKRIEEDTKSISISKWLEDGEKGKETLDQILKNPNSYGSWFGIIVVPDSVDVSDIFSDETT